MQINEYNYCDVAKELADELGMVDFVFDIHQKRIIYYNQEFQLRVSLKKGIILLNNNEKLIELKANLSFDTIENLIIEAAKNHSKYKTTLHSRHIIRRMTKSNLKDNFYGN